MKSLRRLFTAVALPLLIVFVTVGCSGIKQPPTKTLTSIAVTPASPAHLKVGATQQFAATGTYSDNTTADITSTVTWASGTTATATISASGGLATGVAAGTTQITATMGTVTSPGVTLTVIAVTSIAVTPNPASVAVSGTVQLTATGTYSDASTADISSQVTWACAPSTVATISASGLATAGAANGTCQITATLGAIVSPFVTLTVGTGGVPVPVAVKIEQVNPTIPVGSVEDFTAVALLSDGTTTALGTPATWSSGTTANATIITTTTAGVASGIHQGTSTITATSGTLLAGTTVLTVVPAVPRFAYTISPNDGVTSSFVLNGAAPALAPIPPVVDPGTSLQLVFEPSGQFAYAPGALGFISIYTINPVTGVLSPSGLASVAITSSSGTSSITQSAVDPSGRYLYVLDGGNGLVNAYSIDTSNTASKGSLKLPSVPTIAAGSFPEGIAIDPTGTYVYVTNNGDNTISAYKIGADGSLSPIALSVTFGLTAPAIPAIVGNFLYVPNGDSSTNSVSAFLINADGTLTAIATGASAVTTNLSTPFQAAADPLGKFLFVTNFFDGTVASFSIGNTGALTGLTKVPTGITASSLPQGIAVDPSGAFVLVVNDGENSMTLFSLASGALTAKFTAQTRTIPVFASFYGGVAAPVIGPSNVFAANSGSGNVSGFIATPATGALAVGSGSPTAGQASTGALAADVTGTFLYSSSPAGKVFDGFAVTPSNAALAAFTTGSFSLTPNTDTPSEIQTEYTSRVVYVDNTTTNNIQAFTTGAALTPTGVPVSFTSVKSIAVDQQGTYIIALGNGTITSAGISGFNGILQPGGVPNVLTQAGNWSSGAVDPTGLWLVALDSTGNALQVVSVAPVQNGFTAPDGTLTAVGTPVSTGLTKPTSVTFDPLGRFVFVSDAAAGKIAVFTFNESNGTLTASGTPIPVDATGTDRVSIDASGTYLYAAVTGNGSSVPSGVAAYKINSTTGALTALTGSPFATGAGTSGTAGVVATSTVQ